jgi:serine-type D-Ala-D-Ala carboxypeptidase/endopeptidase
MEAVVTVRHLLSFAVGLVALVGGAVAQAVPGEPDVPAILVDRIDVRRQGVGIVVGVIDRQGRRIFVHGSAGGANPRALDGETLFEIGSITKVFTALLLTDMVLRAEVKLDDPVAKYLPAEVKVPQRDNRPIALVDLATHTSGLPRMPANFRSQDTANPFVDYTEAKLYEYLAMLELTRAVGGRYEYSNTGFGLLGHALARRAGLDYETLVETRILRPLGLASTRIALSPELKVRLATGHDVDLQPTANWDFAVLAGTGALRSSANDMLTFLAANLGFTGSPLAEAMQAMLGEQRPMAFFMDIGLGWTVDQRSGGDVIWKDGATGGYRTFIGYAPKSERGIVVLSNAAIDINDIGLHLLDARYRLARPRSFPNEVAVNAAVLQGYVGRYELRPRFVLAVTREGERLFVQATDQQRFMIHPMGDRRFFYKAVEADISFETDAEARAVALVLHQNGVSQRGRRIEDGAGTTDDDKAR